LHVKPHAPIAHVAMEPVGAGHALAQAPQFFGSLVKLAHAPLHVAGAIAGQLLAQAYTTAPPSRRLGAQSGVGAAQTFPHPPQLLGFARSVSQPSSGFDEQCA
jgi:hypothetical protein